MLMSPQIEAELKAAVERAREKPIPWAILSPTLPRNQDFQETLRLEDRVSDHRRPQSEWVEIPVGYRVNVSCEEQPAGVFLHLSVSAKDNLPHPHAVKLILKAIGIEQGPDRVWKEEFLADDGSRGLAINLLFMEQMTAH